MERAPLAFTPPETIGEKQIYKELEKSGVFSNIEEGKNQTLWKFKDFQLKKTIVRRSDSQDSPTVGVIDAVLSKKGKQLARFEGSYHPLGNEISFGLYPFLGGSEKQLLIYDESIHLEHVWIVGLSPKYEEIFDNEDFEVYGGVYVLDIDNDGIMELTAGKLASLSFEFSRNSELDLKVLFKYDPLTHKYLPEPHLFPNVVLNGFERDGFAEQVKKFKEREKKGFSELLQIFMKYIYAGREDEAWKFFDENFSTDKLEFGWEENKVNTREKIIAALKRDKIYHFIKNDLKNRK